jgi:hypothetical protein
MRLPGRVVELFHHTTEDAEDLLYILDIPTAREVLAPSLKTSVSCGFSRSSRCFWCAASIHSGWPALSLLQLLEGALPILPNDFLDIFAVVPLGSPGAVLSIP